MLVAANILSCLTFYKMQHYARHTHQKKTQNTINQPVQYFQTSHTRK